MEASSSIPSDDLLLAEPSSVSDVERGTRFVNVDGWKGSSVSGGDGGECGGLLAVLVDEAMSVVAVREEG